MYVVSPHWNFLRQRDHSMVLFEKNGLRMTFEI